MAIAQARKEKHPQVLERTFRFALDQHGRRWGANVHGRTHDPVERVKPQGWTAPYIPAPQFVKWRYDELDGRYRIEIEYDADIRARREALTEWKKNLVRVGLQMNGSAFDARRPSPEVLQFVGPRPVPPEVPMAAKAGDRWVLGLSQAKPEWAHQFFPDVEDDDAAFLALVGDGGGQAQAQVTQDPQVDEGALAAPAPVVVGAMPRGRPRKAA